MKRARRLLGLTQMKMCRLLGVSRATLARWEAGQGRVPHAVELLVPRLVKEAAEEKGKGRR
jgi:transcriptional regulator with XRE-family HTH domain